MPTIAVVGAGPQLGPAVAGLVAAPEAAEVRLGDVEVLEYAPALPDGWGFAPADRFVAGEQT